MNPSVNSLNEGELKNSTMIKPGFYRPGNRSEGKRTSIAGMYKSQAERLAKYVFRDYFVGLMIDKPGGRWVIVLYKTVENDEAMKEIRNDFIQFWSPFLWTFNYVEEL